MNTIQDEEITLRRQLASLRVNAATEPFRDALHARLAAAPPPSRPGWGARFGWRTSGRGALLWPAIGALTGAALFGLLARTPSADPAPAVAPSQAFVAPAAPAYAVPVSKVALIKVNFAADISVEDATFEIALPAGLAFWSRGERLADRTFRWPGRLDAGDNWLPIAVRGERPGRYLVKARVETGGSLIEHEVVLEVKGAG